MKFQLQIQAVVGLALLAAPMYSDPPAGSQSQRALVSGIPRIPPPHTGDRNPRPFQSVSSGLFESRLDKQSDDVVLKYGSVEWQKMSGRVSELGERDGTSRPDANPDGRLMIRGDASRDSASPSLLGSRGDYQVGAQHGDFLKHSGRFSQGGGVSQIGARPAQVASSSERDSSSDAQVGAQQGDFVKQSGRFSQGGATSGESNRPKQDPGGRQAVRGDASRDVASPSQLGSRGDYQVGAQHGDFLKHSGRFSQGGGVSQLGARPAQAASSIERDSGSDVKVGAEQSDWLKHSGMFSQNGEGVQTSPRPAKHASTASSQSSELGSEGESSEGMDVQSLRGVTGSHHQRSGHIVIDVAPPMSGAETYGQGFAGLIGTPSLSYLGEISPGSTIQLFAENSSGAATSGYLLAGYSAVQEKLRTGATVLASTDILIRRINLSSGTASIPFTIPADALLNGNAVYTQVIMKDSAAFGGWAMTNGLKLNL